MAGRSTGGSRTPPWPSEKGKSAVHGAASTDGEPRQSPLAARSLLQEEQDTHGANPGFQDSLVESRGGDPAKPAAEGTHTIKDLFLPSNFSASATAPGKEQSYTTVFVFFSCVYFSPTILRMGTKPVQGGKAEQSVLA